MKLKLKRKPSFNLIKNKSVCSGKTRLSVFISFYETFDTGKIDFLIHLFY